MTAITCEDGDSFSFLRSLCPEKIVKLRHFTHPIVIPKAVSEPAPSSAGK